LKSIKAKLQEDDPGHGKAISRGVKNWWERRRQQELKNLIKPVDWEKTK
jgi:hypothetical protein